MQVSDVPHTGLDAVLGLRVTSIADDRVTASLPVRAELLDGHGSLHRGVVSSAIESVASIAAAARLGDAGHVVGVANATSHFATAAAGSLTIAAEPVSVLSDRQQWQVRVTDDADELIAQGNVQLANVRDAGQLAT